MLQVTRSINITESTDCILESCLVNYFMVSVKMVNFDVSNGKTKLICVIFNVDKAISGIKANKNCNVELLFGTYK